MKKLVFVFLFFITVFAFASSEVMKLPDRKEPKIKFYQGDKAYALADTGVFSVSNLDRMVDIIILKAYEGRDLTWDEYEIGNLISFFSDKESPIVGEFNYWTRFTLTSEGADSLVAAYAMIHDRLNRDMIETFVSIKELDYNHGTRYHNWHLYENLYDYDDACPTMDSLVYERKKLKSYFLTGVKDTTFIKGYDVFSDTTISDETKIKRMVNMVRWGDLSAPKSRVCYTLDSLTQKTRTELKPRLVVLTDIGPADVEPDDNESAVRLLAYADQFEIEAICTTIGWNCDPYPEQWADYLTRVIDAYYVDVNNLMKRSYQTEFLDLESENGQQVLGYWPSPEYIRSRAMMGSHRAGIGIIGEGNDSPGSDMLIALADEDDPRPIYVTSWGGANTLAQAIWKVKNTRSPEELDAFLRKFRLYTITDQDMQWSMRENRAYSSHQWLRDEFSDRLMLVWDESAWLNQNELGKQNWDKYAYYIQGKGELGKVYPKYLWGVEGDTPSFLNAMPNGLNDPDDPTQVGWGGYHEFALSPDSITYAWTNWQEPVKSISDAYERYFYPVEFNDFAARMAWADEGKGNKNPVVKINGKQYTSPKVFDVRPGEVIYLNAYESYDPDGDDISVIWWQQPEHGKQVDIIPNKYSSNEIGIKIPEDSDPIHIICEVRDSGPFNLVSYCRIILCPQKKINI